MINIFNFIIPPLVIFFICSLIFYKIIIWPIGVPFVVGLGIYYIYKLAGGEEGKVGQFVKGATKTVKKATIALPRMKSKVVDTGMPE